MSTEMNQQTADKTEAEILTDILDGGTNVDADGDVPDLDTTGGLNALMRRSSNLEIPADTDPLSAYMARLKYIEPLPADKQQELAVRYAEKDDMEAAKLLILTNLRLVVKLAKEYQRSWVNLLDLIQEGNVGLGEAVGRFDPYRGVKFTSYAQYWIRAMVLNYLMNQISPVKIGGSRAGRKLFYNLKKARNHLRDQGMEPTASRVAEYLDVDRDDVVRIGAQLDGPPVFLDAQAPGYDGTTVGELMESDSAVQPEDAYSDYQLSSQLRSAIDSFGEGLDDDRERAIWFERMIADDGKTLAELGEDWDVSKERIRQIEAEIRNCFRDHLTSQLGDDVEIDWLS